jgi:hypothetical protein
MKPASLETLKERSHQFRVIATRPGAQDPEHRHRRLLRACRERP